MLYVLSRADVSGDFSSMEAIRIWLNGRRNYEAGVKLYRLYGKDALLKRLFAEPVISPFKIKKLKESLEGLLSASPATVLPTINEPAIVQVEKVVDVPAPVVKEVLTTGWNKEMDATEAELYKEWKPLFVELMNLSSRVGDLAREGKTDPYKKIAAGEMVIRICDLEDAVEEIYDRRDYYLAHGKLPEKWPYGEPCLDPMLQPQKLANAERYIREYKNKLLRKPGDPRATEQLEKHEWFAAYYKKILKKE